MGKKSKNTEEIDWLISTALARARAGRAALAETEGAYYRALAHFHYYAHAVPRDIRDGITGALYDYPVALRAILDAQDEANELTLRARHLRVMDAYEERDGKEK